MLCLCENKLGPIGQSAHTQHRMIFTYYVNVHTRLTHSHTRDDTYNLTTRWFCDVFHALNVCELVWWCRLSLRGIFNARVMYAKWLGWCVQC